MLRVLIQAREDVALAELIQPIEQAAEAGADAMVLHPRIEAAGADMSLIETRTPGRSPWKFPRDADALIDYLERWEGSRPRLPGDREPRRTLSLPRSPMSLRRGAKKAKPNGRYSSLSDDRGL